MKGLKLEVTLNKMGATKLETPLMQTVIIPVSDKSDARSWQNHFAAEWPKNTFPKPDFNDVMIEGLKVLARRATVKNMMDTYKAANPSAAGGRGKRSKQELLDL